MYEKLYDSLFYFRMSNEESNITLKNTLYLKRFQHNGNWGLFNKHHWDNISIRKDYSDSARLACQCLEYIDDLYARKWSFMEFKILQTLYKVHL